MYISPIVFMGSFWNFLSILSNVLSVTICIYVLIQWFLYEWEILKCDYPCFQKFSPKQREFLKRLNKLLDLLYEVEKTNNYWRKRTSLMKNFTLAALNTINEKCVPGTEQSKIFQNKKNLSPWPARNWSTTLVFINVSSSILGADPGYLERGGVEPWPQFCRVKRGGTINRFYT